MEKFPLFFEEFFNYFKQEKQEIDYFLFQNTNAFFHEKLLHTLKLKNNFNDSLREYGDTLINKLVLDLICLQKQSLGIKNLCLGSFGTGIVFNILKLKLNFNELKSFIKILE